MINKANFDTCFEVSSAGSKKVRISTIQKTGSIPVIDQGKKFISGYVNSQAFKYKGRLPCLVYGDHSKEVKYIDFDFAIGADGVKILTEKEGFNLRFLYYYLKSIKLPATGYDRSFKFLKKIKVPVFNLDYQKKAVAILDRVQLSIDSRQHSTNICEELYGSVFNQMFGDTYKNPFRFKLEKLKDLVKKDKIITYGIVQAGPNIEDGIPYIKAGDVKNGKITSEKLSRTSKEIAESYKRSQCEFGDIIITIRATVGSVAILPLELNGANLTQDTARISCDESIVNNVYLYNAIISNGTHFKLKKKTKGATLQGISLTALREISIPIPPLDDQLKFKTVYESISLIKQYFETGLEKFNELYASVLQLVLTGKKLIDEGEVFEELLKGFDLEDFIEKPERIILLRDIISKQLIQDFKNYEIAKKIIFEILKNQDLGLKQVYNFNLNRLELKLNNEIN